MIWTASWRADPEARVIADRHYNRQSVGAKQFVPPGRCLVLRANQGVALWITSWPFAEYVQHAWAGAWVCSAFRRESGPMIASEMILQAIAATRDYFGEPPKLGMITFVDASKVRRKRDPGRCYTKAGFQRAGMTKGGLVALRMSPTAMPPAQPAINDQFELFGEEAV